MTSHAHGQNPYQASKVGTLLFWLFFHGLALMILLAVLLVIVPVFDNMFIEYGLKLPHASVLVINSSRFLSQFALLIIPLGLIFDSGILYLLIMAGGLPRWLRHLWCRGVLIVAAFLIVLVAIVLVLPLVGLSQRIS